MLWNIHPTSAILHCYGNPFSQAAPPPLCPSPNLQQTPGGVRHLQGGQSPPPQPCVIAVHGGRQTELSLHTRHCPPPLTPPRCSFTPPFQAQGLFWELQSWMVMLAGWVYSRGILCRTRGCLGDPCANLIRGTPSQTPWIMEDVPAPTGVGAQAPRWDLEKPEVNSEFCTSLKTLRAFSLQASCMD